MLLNDFYIYLLFSEFPTLFIDKSKKRSKNGVKDNWCLFIIKDDWHVLGLQGDHIHDQN